MEDWKKLAYALGVPDAPTETDADRERLIGKWYLWMLDHGVRQFCATDRIALHTPPDMEVWEVGLGNLNMPKAMLHLICVAPSMKKPKRDGVMDQLGMMNMAITAWRLSDD
jgi:hypothetical protein